MQWDFLQWYFFQWGHVFFFGFLSLSFSFFFFLQDLDILVFLCLRSQDLCCSSNELLSELVPYADLVYLEAVVLSFIIVLRKEIELATERPVVAIGAVASLRALTPLAPTSYIRIVWSDIASCR